MTYINKTLDVHMPVLSNNVIFEIVDQDCNPINLSWCLIEGVFYRGLSELTHTNYLHTKS